MWGVSIDELQRLGASQEEKETEQRKMAAANLIAEASRNIQGGIKAVRHEPPAIREEDMARQMQVCISTPLNPLSSLIWAGYKSKQLSNSGVDE